MFWKFCFAMGLLVALGTCVWWGPLVGVRPGHAFAYAVIAAIALWLAVQVADMIGIMFRGQ